MSLYMEISINNIKILVTICKKNQRQRVFVILDQRPSFNKSFLFEFVAAKYIEYKVKNYSWVSKWHKNEYSMANTNKVMNIWITAVP